MEQETPAEKPAVQVPGILFAVAIIWQEAVPVPCIWAHAYVGGEEGQLLLRFPQQASVISLFAV